MPFRKRVVILKNKDMLPLGTVTALGRGESWEIRVSLFSHAEDFSLEITDCEGRKNVINEYSSDIPIKMSGDFSTFEAKLLKKGENAHAFTDCAYRVKEDSSFGGDEEEFLFEKVAYGFEGEVATVNYYEKELPIEVASDPTKIVVKKAEDEDDFIPYNNARKVEDINSINEGGKEVNPGAGKFYEKIKEQLDDLFEKHEENEYLNSIIPSSKWASIPYGEDKSYSVGIIKEDGDVTFIGYAVESEYSDESPKELGENAQWAPLDLSEPRGTGYWLIFQSAEDGSNL